jgi:SPP1 gp7 family putative phage head morphogenesis protein
MAFSLPQIWRETRPPRSSRTRIVLRPITISPVLAGDLYRAAFAHIIEAWRAALPQLEAEYARTLAELVQDAPADLSATMSAVEQGIAARAIAVTVALRRWADLAERHHRARWRGAVLSATKVDLATMIGAEAARITLEVTLERNVALVASVAQETRTRIASEVFQGFTERRPARDIGKAISEAVEMSRRRALNIAADQTSKLAAQLNVERAREAGISQYEWMSSHKKFPRAEHAARDGKVFTYGTPAGDEPGMAIHCGCVARAVLEQ